MSDNSNQHYVDDEIELKEVFAVLWSGKWFISAVTSVAAMLSIVIALWSPNIYTASAVLASADRGEANLSGVLEQYGGLAGLAGVALSGGAGGNKTSYALELMKSRKFVGGFVERHNILPELMAVESWHRSTDTLTFNDSVYASESGEWVRDVRPPFKSRPSMLEAHERFLKILSVDEDKLAGYTKLSISHHSPTVAAQWVHWLVEDINAVVKAQDVEEAKKSIEYLQQQIANTSLADLQAMFFELIQSQTETVMLAEVRPEYVFTTIDPAVVPEVRSGPNRALIFVQGTLLGGMLGVVIVLFRHYARSAPTAFSI
jgi:uncharacterized protein involved in exopolysaccharide biosynthesis